mmetsp:Transcript_3441/g.8426  ORF Transcript_3441/g.8426 Transcript_3441/m.8426 type:complete len:429 (+) Transcript_3441:152-1438(+)
MSAQAEDADMPPLADAPPMQPDEGAAESKQPEEEEASDEDAPLIEPLTILKLLHGFCGDGTTPPDADKREKAGQLLWDLSATKAHACVIGPHASTLLDTARGAPDRVAEVALGIYTNVCGWLPELAKSEDARELVATALVGSEDPGLLTESLRLMQTCFLVLREERDRSKLLKPFADAWASLAISLKARVLFCIENSLDAKLVARALELAFAARFFPDHDGDCDVFNALCVEDALLKAVLDALQDVGSEDLHATKLDDHGDGLDSALRVVELCALRPRELSKEELVKQREARPEIRARAVERLRDAHVSDPDAVPRDAATATVALANFGADTKELRDARSPARLVQGFCTALEVALSTGPAKKGNVNPAAAAACFMLCRVFSQKDQGYDLGEGIILGEDEMRRLEHALGWAKDCGLEIPELLRGELDS